MNRSLPLRRLAAVLALVAAAAAVTSAAASAGDYMTTIQSTRPLAHWGMGEASGNVAWDSVASYHATFPMTMRGITRGVPGGVARGGADPLATHIAPRDWMTAPLSQGWWNGRAAFSANLWLRWDGYVYDDYGNPLAAGIIGNLNFNYQVGGWGLDILYDSPSRVRMIRHAYGAPVATTSTVPIEVGKWTMLTAVYDGLALNLYQDGVRVGHVIDSSLQSNGYNHLYVGAQDYNLFFSGYFGPGKGAYDEITVWNRALTAQEVEDIHDATKQAPRLVFVPGVAGSELRWRRTAHVDQTIWPNAIWSHYYLEPERVDGLAVRENGEESVEEVDPTKVLDSFRAPPYLDERQPYQAALDTFRSWQTRGWLEEFVPFPYDWRLGTRVPAELLVAEIVERCEQGPLWLAAHSTGGLVVKRALRMLRERGISPEVCLDGGGVFFLATPHEGAPKALGSLINPDLFFEDSGQTQRALREDAFAHVLNNWLTAWELTPRRYGPEAQPSDARESWFDDTDDGFGDLNRNHERLNWSLDDAAQQAYPLHNRLPETIGALPVYNVFGYESQTSNSYTPGRCVTDFAGRRSWVDQDSDATVDGAAIGDGTVPLWSAIWPQSGLRPVAQYGIGSVPHGEIPNDAHVLTLIREILLSPDPQSYPDWPTQDVHPRLIHLRTEAEVAELQARALNTWYIHVCSPLAVVAEYGGLENGVRGNGSSVAENPRVLVEVAGASDGHPHQTIVLPDEGHAPPRLTLEATGSGRDVSVWIDEPDGSQHDFVFDVVEGDRGTVDLVAGRWQLALDRGGDGSVDETLVANHPVVRLLEPPTRVGEGEQLTLRSEAHGRVGSSVSYEWTLVSGEGSLSGDGATATFMAGDGPGSARIRVTATDSGGRSAYAETTIAVDNVPPTASAGPDRTAPWGVPIALDGSASDPSAEDAAAGLPVRWTFGDGGESATLSTTHTWLAPGGYAATLTVSDKDGGTANDEAVVTVTKRAATLRSDSPAAVPYGTRTFTGSLADSVDPATGSLGGHRLTFTLAGAEHVGESDATGRASVELPLPLGVGAHQLAVSLAADALYTAAPAQATVQVVNTRGGVAGGLAFPSGARAAVVAGSDGALARGFLLWRAANGSTISVPAVTAYGGDAGQAWFSGRTASGAHVVAHVVERVGPDRLELWVDGVAVADAGDASEGSVAVAGG